MRTPFQFVISPINNEQYINTIKSGNSELVINTSIEDAQDVQRIGEVISCPFNYKGVIRPGDLVVVQHNVFRITFDDWGVPRQSTNHIKDNLFAVTSDIIYMVIRDGVKIASDDYIFVEPIVEEDFWLGKQELENVGIAKYVNKELERQGVFSGTKVAFGKSAKYLFEIFGEKLFLMRNKKILAIVN